MTARCLADAWGVRAQGEAFQTLRLPGYVATLWLLLVTSQDGSIREKWAMSNGEGRVAACPLATCAITLAHNRPRDGVCEQSCLPVRAMHLPGALHLMRVGYDNFLVAPRVGGSLPYVSDCTIIVAQGQAWFAERKGGEAIGGCPS